MMENVGATRRFCPACLAKRSAEKARNAERAKRAEWKEWEAQRRVEQELRKAFPHPTAENSIQAVNARAEAAGRTYGQQVLFERRQKELKNRGEI